MLPYVTDSLEYFGGYEVKANYAIASSRNTNTQLGFTTTAGISYAGYCYFSTINTVNLSKFSILSITFSPALTSAQWGTGKAGIAVCESSSSMTWMDNVYADVIQKVLSDTNGVSTLTMDISSLNGKYYIQFAGAVKGGGRLFDISSIKLS